jgi:flagellar hook-associated protein 2
MRIESNFLTFPGAHSDMMPLARENLELGNSPEHVQIESARSRRQVDVERKQSIQSMGSMLDSLSSLADGLKNPRSFQEMVVESSNPEVVGGETDGTYPAGTYEVEVQALARTGKFFSHGFPDKDETYVGFGFLSVDLNGENHPVVIEPGAKLKDVADAINDTVSGVRAMIVNTGHKDEPYTLMLSSLTPGEQVSFSVDTDTTLVDFSKKIDGQDLKFRFEGVDIQKSTNNVTDLVEGLMIHAKSVVPGAKTTLQVKPDTEKTSDKVKSFVEQYNQIQSFGRQVNVDQNDDANFSRKDPLLRQVTTSLQSVIGQGNLFDIGITTDPKNGQLRLDESRLKSVLQSSYDKVAKLFVSDTGGDGLAEKLQLVIKSLKDKSTGAVAQRINGLEQRIRRQDRDIERKEEQLQTKAAEIGKRLSMIESRMNSQMSHKSYLDYRMGTESQA